MIGLNLHAARNAAEGLTAGEIRDVDECIVVTGVDVAVSEDVLLGLGGGADFLLNDNFLGLYLGWLGL